MQLETHEFFLFLRISGLLLKQCRNATFTCLIFEQGFKL